ncbi:Cys/Met metabolism PLP-dependent enzyme-domain-containing protein [Daldinia vernicosa]|uniref:Cys/Met metabolism PLP-dependent enzyme-domain-containing protein n=1 Tax=Daldinia vernicosa TaxID=114800 RepID=UPI002007E5DE|nr:Cys/Met metabolism PLP-dependent enzyme-domain-containing protein [Daldinia vernicosa]KAI0845503.1 Cys/Met metabolism PLP-dependent enzyme-domain-containing protein [Daldinia vernicosa]
MGAVTDISHTFDHNPDQEPPREFETQLLHAGRFPDILGSCAVPVYSSAPTVNTLQNRLAELEGGVAACAVASGSAAVAMTILALAGAGDNFVSSFHVHAGTFHQFSTLATQMGIECRFVKSRDPVDFAAAIDDKTKFVWVESISNPGNVILDFEALSLVCHAKGVPLICDNTFGCAGYFCRPIDHGVDILVHSATKWIGGHGTTVGGIIVDSGAFDWGSHADRFPQFHDPRTRLWERFSHRSFAIRCQFEILRDTGSTLSAAAAQQLLIGLESLAVRCERHAQNTAEIADWLREQPLVAWVNYVGHQDHRDHREALRYFKRGFGSVICFGLKGGFEASARLCDAFKMIMITTNLGDAKTLVVHPASTTHEHFSPHDRAEVGVTEDMIRLSVGIENIKDIKADFQQAFEQVLHAGTSKIREVKGGKIQLQDEINGHLYGPSARPWARVREGGNMG